MAKQQVTYEIDIPDGYELVSVEPVHIEFGGLALKDGEVIEFHLMPSTSKYFSLRKIAENVN